MSKRKTRQQKIIAQLRRKMQIAAQKSELPETQSSKTNKIAVPKYAFSAPTQAALIHTRISSTTHVIPDVKKTFLVTSAVIFAQLLLYFLLTKHFVTIPAVSY